MVAVVAVPGSTLRDLRAMRRRKQVARIDRWEALYRAYVTAILGIAVTLVVSSFVGDEPVSAAGMANVIRHGPAAIGLIAALAIAVGLRSGSRGGPLALEPAEVRYVLLAPVRRRDAVLGPALRQLRYAVFIGAVVGAIIGQLAYRRFEEDAAAWVGFGALVAAAIAVLLIGVALVASGLRLPRWAATVLGLVVLAWAAADLAELVPAPTTTLGSLALWPLRVHWIDLLGVVAVLVVTAIGLAVAGGVSIEAAERRSALVGQLRFAATVQDLRTVMLLRRQLAQDRPRRRPWFRLPGRGRRLPVWRRGWHGFLRFPVPRLFRLVLLAAAAGFAAHATFHGTTPLILASGLVLYLAGLDAVEPMAQEIDQADRADALPVERGVLLLRHLAAPGVVMAVVGLIGGAVVVALNRTSLSVELAAVCFLPMAWAGGAAAAVSTTMGAPEPFKDGQLLPPEVAGMHVALRAAWPLIVATAGGVPVLFAERAYTTNGDPVGAATQGSFFVLVVIVLVVAYVRYREPAKAWWARFLEEGQQASRERQRAKQER